MNAPRRNAWLGLVAWIVLCFAAAAIGSAFTTPSLEPWYRDLAKPPGNPPNWIFGPVWSALYLAMAIAAWRVWKTRRLGEPALKVFGVQLALNTLWSVLFFYTHNPGAALVDIVLLWAGIATTLAMFWRIDRVAGALFVPYLAWVSFATYLNAAIWWLNR
jgi:tryptophan-rich sensory protein